MTPENVTHPIRSSHELDMITLMCLLILKFMAERETSANALCKTTGLSPVGSNNNLKFADICDLYLISVFS